MASKSIYQNLHTIIYGGINMEEHIILDPELTLILPKYQTAFTGMDALCQGIESFWSVNSAEQCKEYAAKAIELILENLQNVVEDPEDLKARKEMLLGENYSGKSINIYKTTAAHACSYINTSTSKFGIPHEHAVAIMMKGFLKYNGTNFHKTVDERGEEYLRETVDDLYSFLGCSAPKESSEFLQKKMNKIGLEKTLENLCPKTPLNEFIKGVNEERIKNNPIDINKSELEIIF